MAIFNHREFGNIRAMAINDVAWFAARDVARALGYPDGDAALAKYVDSNDKMVIQRADNVPFAVPIEGLILINLSGLYSLILASDHPELKKFERWLGNVVLPALHSTAAPIEHPAATEHVDHPAHYNTSVECIDLIEQTQGVEATLGFCIGNAIKYIYRHRQKNGIEDIKKAVWYLQRYIASAESDTQNR